jgi:hypothetical protein
MALDADHTRWFRVPDGGNHLELNIRHRSSIRMLPATDERAMGQRQCSKGLQ